MLFAATLFFAGIATLLKRMQATYVLLAVATVSSVGGLVVLFAAIYGQACVVVCAGESCH